MVNAMSNLKWNPGDYPHDQQIWTDKDLFKWMLIAFIAGFIIGIIL
jgi:hypothetical protein